MGGEQTSHDGMTGQILSDVVRVCSAQGSSGRGEMLLLVEQVDDFESDH